MCMWCTFCVIVWGLVAVVSDASGLRVWYSWFCFVVVRLFCVQVCGCLGVSLMLLLVDSFACDGIGFYRFWEFGEWFALYCYDRRVFCVVCSTGDWGLLL